MLRAGSGVQSLRQLPGAMIDIDFVKGLCYGGSMSSVLAITRATTGWAVDTNGRIWSYPSGTFRINNTGLTIEAAATNLAIQGRDLTQAGTWTATNMTTAHTSVGADGVANSGTRCTAGAINATLLQVITGASTARTLQFWIRRVTGTGTVNLTQDGVTWTDFSATLNTSTYTRCVLTATQLNPTIGIQLGTSGDAVDVDFVGLEATAWATSPIATTTVAVTRNSDVIVTTGGLNNYLMNNYTASMYESVLPEYASNASIGTRTYGFAADDAGFDRNYVSFEETGSSAPRLTIGDGATNTTVSTGLTVSVNVPAKYAARWSRSISDISIRGALSAGSLPQGAASTVRTWSAGVTQFGVGSAQGVCNGRQICRRIAVFGTTLIDAQLNTLVLPHS